MVQITGSEFAGKLGKLTGDTMQTLKCQLFAVKVLFKSQRNLVVYLKASQFEKLIRWEAINQ